MLSSSEYLAIRVVLPILIGIAITLTVLFYNKSKPEFALWAGYVAYAIFGLLMVALIHEAWLSEKETTSGLLRPAHDPTPLTPCPSIPNGALILVLGNSASYTEASHHTFLQVAGEDLLSIDRKKGGVAVSAKIYSADRKIVAEIIDNNFHINPSN